MSELSTRQAEDLVSRLRKHSVLREASASVVNALPAGATAGAKDKVQPQPPAAPAVISFGGLATAPAGTTVASSHGSAAGVGGPQEPQLRLPAAPAAPAPNISFTAMAGPPQSSAAAAPPRALASLGALAAGGGTRAAGLGSLGRVTTVRPVFSAAATAAGSATDGTAAASDSTRAGVAAVGVAASTAPPASVSSRASSASMSGSLLSLSSSGLGASLSGTKRPFAAMSGEAGAAPTRPAESKPSLSMPRPTLDLGGDMPLTCEDLETPRMAPTTAVEQPGSAPQTAATVRRSTRLNRAAAAAASCAPSPSVLLGALTLASTTKAPAAASRTAGATVLATGNLGSIMEDSASQEGGGDSQVKAAAPSPVVTAPRAKRARSSTGGVMQAPVLPAPAPAVAPVADDDAWFQMQAGDDSGFQMRGEEEDDDDLGGSVVALGAAVSQQAAPAAPQPAPVAPPAAVATTALPPPSPAAAARAFSFGGFGGGGVGGVGVAPSFGGFGGPATAAPQQHQQHVGAAAVAPMAVPASPIAAGGARKTFRPTTVFSAEALAASPVRAPPPAPAAAQPLVAPDSPDDAFDSLLNSILGNGMPVPGRLGSEDASIADITSLNTTLNASTLQPAELASLVGGATAAAAAARGTDASCRSPVRSPRRATHGELSPLSRALLYGGGGARFAASVEADDAGDGNSAALRGLSTPKSGRPRVTSQRPVKSATKPAPPQGAAGGGAGQGPLARSPAAARGAADGELEAALGLQSGPPPLSSLAPAEACLAEKLRAAAAGLSLSPPTVAAFSAESSALLSHSDSPTAWMFGLVCASLLHALPASFAASASFLAREADRVAVTDPVAASFLAFARRAVAAESQCNGDATAANAENARRHEKLNRPFAGAGKREASSSEGGSASSESSRDGMGDDGEEAFTGIASGLAAAKAGSATPIRTPVRSSGGASFGTSALADGSRSGEGHPTPRRERPKRKCVRFCTSDFSSAGTAPADMVRDYAPPAGHAAAHDGTAPSQAAFMLASMCDCLEAFAEAGPAPEVHAVLSAVLAVVEALKGVGDISVLEAALTWLARSAAGDRSHSGTSAVPCVTLTCGPALPLSTFAGAASMLGLDPHTAAAAPHRLTKTMQLGAIRAAAGFYSSELGRFLHLLNVAQAEAAPPGWHLDDGVVTFNFAVQGGGAAGRPSTSPSTTTHRSRRMLAAIQAEQRAETGGDDNDDEMSGGGGSSSSGGAAGYPGALLAAPALTASAAADVERLPFRHQLGICLSSAVRFQLRRAFNSHVFDGDDEAPAPPTAAPGAPASAFAAAAGHAEHSGHHHHHHSSHGHVLQPQQATATPLANIGGVGRGGGGIRGGYLAFASQGSGVPGAMQFNTYDLAAVVHKALRELHAGRPAAEAALCPLGLLPSRLDAAPSMYAPGAARATTPVPGATVTGAIEASDLTVVKALYDFAAAHRFIRAKLSHEPVIGALQEGGEVWKWLRTYARMIRTYRCRDEEYLIPLEDLLRLHAALDEEAEAVDELFSAAEGVLDRLNAVHAERKAKNRRVSLGSSGIGVSSSNASSSGSKGSGSSAATARPSKARPNKSLSLFEAAEGGASGASGSGLPSLAALTSEPELPSAKRTLFSSATDEPNASGAGAGGHALGGMAPVSRGELAADLPRRALFGVEIEPARLQASSNGYPAPYELEDLPAPRIAASSSASLSSLVDESMDFSCSGGGGLFGGASASHSMNSSPTGLGGPLSTSSSFLGGATAVPEDVDDLVCPSHRFLYPILKLHTCSLDAKTVYEYGDGQATCAGAAAAAVQQHGSGAPASSSAAPAAASWSAFDSHEGMSIKSGGGAAAAHGHHYQSQHSSAYHGAFSGGAFDATAVLAAAGLAGPAAAAGRSTANGMLASSLDFAMGLPAYGYDQDDEDVPMQRAGEVAAPVPVTAPPPAAPASRGRGATRGKGSAAVAATQQAPTACGICRGHVGGGAVAAGASSSSPAAVVRCSRCPAAFHLACTGLQEGLLQFLAAWLCPDCDAL